MARWESPFQDRKRLLKIFFVRQKMTAEDLLCKTEKDYWRSLPKIGQLEYVKYGGLTKANFKCELWVGFLWMFSINFVFFLILYLYRNFYIFLHIFRRNLVFILNLIPLLKLYINLFTYILERVLYFFLKSNTYIGTAFSYFLTYL